MFLPIVGLVLSYLQLTAASSTTSGRLELAVARPFCPSEVKSLLLSFKSWEEFRPCRENSKQSKSRAHVDLFLVFSQSLDTSPEARKAADSVVHQFNQTRGWSYCFRNVFVTDVQIDPSLDLYLPSQQDSNPNWVNGPNRQFERLIHRVEERERKYDAVYLMEMDSVPVKRFWLDHLVAETERKRPFAILGSRYTGDKWDSFYERLPPALVNHINGNAIYNLTSAVFKSFLLQLELEASSQNNRVPFDLRMSQMGEEFTMPSVVSEARGLLKETRAIANYAKTNVMSSHIENETSIVHGASFHLPWNRNDEDLSLVISSFGELNSLDLLSLMPSLKGDGHAVPFSKVIIMLPPGANLPDLSGLSLSTPITAHYRGRDEPEYMDLCTSPVNTSWFMMTDTFHRVKPHNLYIMRTSDGRPVIPYLPGEFCLQYPSCKAEHVASFNQGCNKAIQNVDMIYRTDMRDEMCSKLGTPIRGERNSSARIKLSEAPTATLYASFVDINKGAEDVYLFTDKNEFGSRNPFAIHPHPPANVQKRNLLETSNETGCELNISEEECVRSPLDCGWRHLFGSCHAENGRASYHYLSMKLDGLGPLSSTDATIWELATSSHIAKFYNLNDGAQGVETLIISQSGTRTSRLSISDSLFQITIQYKQRFTSSFVKANMLNSTYKVWKDVLTAPFIDDDDTSSFVAMLRKANYSTFMNASVNSVDMTVSPDSLESLSDGDDTFSLDPSGRWNRKGVTGLVIGISGAVIIIAIVAALFIWDRARPNLHDPIYEIESSISTNEIVAMGKNDDLIDAYAGDGHEEANQSPEPCFDI